MSPGPGAAAGSLVGINNSGTISASYATGSVTGSVNSWSLAKVGGLVGENHSAISASYATGLVTGTSYGGGLVGLNGGHSSRPKAIIISSYATGAVKGTGSNVGGLVGSDGSGPYRGTATNSYWDTGTTGQSISAAGTGKTTRELQSPTGYTGIYATWNMNLDGVAGNDAPWDFGVNGQYPALKYGGLDPFHQRSASLSVQSVNRNIPIVGGPVATTLDATGATASPGSGKAPLTVLLGPTLPTLPARLTFPSLRTPPVEASSCGSRCLSRHRARTER